MRKFALVPLVLLAAAVATVFVAFRLPASQPLHANESFDAYLQQFPLQPLPYSLGEAELMPAPDVDTKDADYYSNVKIRPAFDNSFLEKQSSTFQNERFSRVPVMNEPVARVETPEYQVVIIRRGRGFSRPFAGYVAVVFNRDGKFQNHFTVAQVGPERLTTCRIEPSLQTTLRRFTRENIDEKFVFEAEERIDLKAPIEEGQDQPRTEKPIKRKSPDGARAR